MGFASITVSLVFRMTSAQRSDNLPRAEKAQRDLRTTPMRVKESIAGVHASLLAKHASYAVLVSLAIAIWGGAGGVGALIDAINHVYDVRNTRSFIKETALKFGLMLLGGALVVGSFILLAFGRLLGEWVAGKVGRGTTLVNFLSSSPVWALLLLACSLFLLYWLAPDVRKSIRWILPGTALATIAVLITFAVMDLLLRFSNPGSAFGAAGSVLILLWALFLVSAIVIVGGIVNAVLGRRYDRVLRDALRQAEKRPLRGEIAVSEYR
jgi:membrane protein